jgi:predicted small integral membrane protein
VRTAALKYLMEQMKLVSAETAAHYNVVVTDTHFGICPFHIRRGSRMNISCFVSVVTNLMWLEVTFYTAAFAVCSKDKGKIIFVLGYVITH